MINSALANEINWTTTLSQELIDQLTAIAQIKTNLKTSELEGSDIAHQGISLVLEGTVAVCLQTPSLKTVNNIIMGKGGWFGSYDKMDSDYKPFFLSQIEDVTLINFKNTHLERLANNNLEIYKWFHSLSFEPKAKWLQSQIIMSANTLSRVVYLLLEIAAHKPRLRGEQPKISISQQQISRITGIARQRVNEAIKQLEKEQMLHLERGCIYLKSIAGLNAKLDALDLSIRDPRCFL